MLTGSIMFYSGEVDDEEESFSQGKFGLYSSIIYQNTCNSRLKLFSSDPLNQMNGYA